MAVANAAPATPFLSGPTKSQSRKMLNTATSPTAFMGDTESLAPMQAACATNERSVGIEAIPRMCTYAIDISMVASASADPPVKKRIRGLAKIRSIAVIPAPIIEVMKKETATTRLAPPVSLRAIADARRVVVATARKFARYVTMSQRAVPGPSAASASLLQNCPTAAVSTRDSTGFARKIPNVGTMNWRSSMVLGTRRMPNAPSSSCEIDALFPRRSSDMLPVNPDTSRPEMSELSCRAGVPARGVPGAPNSPGALPPRSASPGAVGALPV
mmetsp:Transcript_40857/g.96832  ORF Transcript_40857/g.96832 Transcript_40857/m.96832 type:complete len:272 (+) Transcript_40857:953-1768(+)